MAGRLELGMRAKRQGGSGSPSEGVCFLTSGCEHVAECGQLSCTDVGGGKHAPPPLQPHLPHLDCVVTILTVPACGGGPGSARSILVPGVHFTSVETQTQGIG